MPMGQYKSWWPLQTGATTAYIASTGVNQNFATSGFNLVDYNGYAVQAIYTGNVLGTASLEGTIGRPLEGAQIPSLYTTISGTTQVLASSGNFIWNVSGAYYRGVRVRWASSGIAGTTGTIAFAFNAKQF